MYSLEPVFSLQYAFGNDESPYSGLALDSAAEYIYTTVYHHDHERLDIIGHALSGDVAMNRVVSIFFDTEPTHGCYVERDFGLLNNDMLAIVLDSYFILFEPSSGRQLERLARDEGSPYYIGEGIAIYFLNRKLMAFRVP